MGMYQSHFSLFNL